MRLATRLTLLKLAAAIGGLAAVLVAMHFILPGMARRREQELLGDRYAVEESARLRIWSPREIRLAPFVAQGFEAFTAALYQDYGAALGLKPVEDKITIRLFATHKDLTDFALQRMKQDLSHAGGFYDPASWSLALTLRPPRDLLATLFHEATHLVLSRSAPPGDPAWSLWVSEGLAGFFEESKMVGDRLRLGGANPRDALLVLALQARGRHIPLRQLVRGGPELFHGDLGSLAYRESALLVAFLIDGPERKYRDRFLRYYHIERQPGPCPPGALETNLDVSLDDLEKEWLTYLQGITR